MLKNNDSDYPVKNTLGDISVSLGKGIIGMIPLVGAPASELLSLIITPSLEERRQVWFQNVGERLQGLEKDKAGFLKKLSKNDDFIDIVLHATRVALQTSQQEKREALKNAILNATDINYSFDISMQQMFINYIESFTIWHIKLLTLFDNPQNWAKKNKAVFQEEMIGGLSRVVETAFTDLRGHRDVYDSIWRDLFSRGLVNTDGLHTTMSYQGLMTKRTTPIGSEFIKYITYE
jgi:hypothetical protein